MGRTPRSSARSGVFIWALSLSEWRHKIQYLALVVAALFLIISNKQDHPFNIGLRNALMNAVAPIVGFANQPMAGLHSFGNQWQQWQDVYTENEALRQENVKLREWHRLATGLNSENKSLRKLLRVAPSHSGHFISGKMLGGGIGSFNRSQFIGLGKEDGIKQDMAVISTEGLVGRIQETAEGYSRVMLLTDINSRIAVLTHKGQEHAMITGRNDGLLELRYLPKDTKIKIGESVVTSGDAALMPAGITIGKVVQIKPQILVKPAVDWARLVYVSVIASEEK